MLSRECTWLSLVKYSRVRTWRPGDRTPLEYLNQNQPTLTHLPSTAICHTAALCARNGTTQPHTEKCQRQQDRTNNESTRHRSNKCCEILMETHSRYSSLYSGPVQGNAWMRHHHPATMGTSLCGPALLLCSLNVPSPSAF